MDAIIESLLKRIEGLQQQLLAAIEREQQKDKLIEQLAAENLQLKERIARLEKNSLSYGLFLKSVLRNRFQAFL